MIDRMMGGLIPYVQVGREKYFAETTWWLQVTWLRASIKIEMGW